MEHSDGFVSWFKWLFGGVGAVVLGAYISKNKLSKREKVTSDRKKQTKELFSTNISFRIRFANEYDIIYISDLANRYLGEGHGIPLELASSWHRKNSNIFRIIECTTHALEDTNVLEDRSLWHFCGYYSVVPLHETTYKLLKNGKIQDYQINSDSILSFRSNKLKSIYVMDLMTVNDEKCCNSYCGTALLKDMISFIRKLLKDNPNIAEISTITASKEGRKLAARFGMTMQPDYDSGLGWDFWSITKSDLNIKQNLSKYAILRYDQKFRETYIF